MRLTACLSWIVVIGLLAAVPPALAEYVNFESAHVHPIALTPGGGRLLAVNTPDAVLEVFTVGAGGALIHERAIRVGYEPVSVVARTDDEAWVVNQLSDSVSIVDLAAGLVLRTLEVGDEPTDVAFASGKAFVSVAGEHVVRVFELGNLDAAPSSVELFTLKPRALASDGARIYAVALFSGNRTTIVSAHSIFQNGLNLNPGRLDALGLNDIDCDGAPPSYPPLPAGIARNPALQDPPPDEHPEVGLIARWDEGAQAWVDDAGQDWTRCLPYRMPDHDLFVIDAASLAVQTVDHLGTSLFDVSIQPGSGKIWVPHTEARNAVRFEHALGVQGHVVENRVAVVDPAAAFATTQIDLNAHIDRDSDPATNLAERSASISQPGMLVWSADGTTGWLTGIGTRKLFKLDGSCAAGGCIFGANRAAPAAVEVGEGPTGVALDEAASRAYVMLRFTNAIAVVDTAALAKIDEIALHDPSPPTVLEGRRFLYDAIDGSGHGDAACASCHLFGDRDGLAWDLGNPAGTFVSYDEPLDNVRFAIPLGGLVECPLGSPACNAHDGFDPQKGPMTTQTLRGMLEPLHWRGDRPTMNDFNAAFVDLMGTADIGPIAGAPAGLSASDMERFRQFALALPFPPNPLRRLDDTLPNEPVPVPGTPFSGNPASGRILFDTAATDANQPCQNCHTHPFGAGGGRLGGVTPQSPTSSDAAALFNGTADGSNHSDLKIPHLRNMHEKIGPVFGTTQAPELVRSGFGFTHDGSIPDLGTFLSASVFTVNAGQVRDISAFMAHFPSGTRSAVGAQVTLPPGAPAKAATRRGPADDGEQKLSTLLALGDRSDADRHCELTATTVVEGAVSGFYLDGAWVPDRMGDAPLSTEALRSQAEAPLNFVCVTVGEGVRLAADRDEDAFLNRDDCAPADPATWGDAQPVEGLSVHVTGPFTLEWRAQSTGGPSMRYAVAGSALDELHALQGAGLETAECLASGLIEPRWRDTRPSPAPGVGYWYLVRAENPCGPGSFGTGREGLAGSICE